MTNNNWWVLHLSLCFSIKDPRSFSYKFDMGFNSWIISGLLIQAKDQGNSEYAHVSFGTEQDTFTSMDNSRIPTLPYTRALVVTKSELQLALCTSHLLTPFLPPLLPSQQQGERNNMLLMWEQGYFKSVSRKKVYMWHYQRGQAISWAINIPDGASHWGSSLLSS